MSLPVVPPRYASWREMVAPLKKGASGWAAYAVQRVVGVTADGVWGPMTDKAVYAWQSSHRDEYDRWLVVDGVVGPTTQYAMLLAVAISVDRTTTAIPDGVLKGMVTYEGARLLAATNWYTPPGGTPGADCGAAQWRQYGPPFSMSGLLAAFDPKVALQQVASRLSGRITNYKARRPSLTDQRALELAVLAHNAPFLAEQVVRNGRLSTPDAEAVWTTKADGSHYTHAEWSVEYPSRILSYTKGIE